MNIQEFIKAKEEEFDEKFLKTGINPEEKFMVLHTADIPELKQFLSQSLLEYNEKIKGIIEEAPPMTRTECEEGNPIDKDDIITNLTQDTNPKE